MEHDSNNEIILYQPDDELKLDVRVEDETVWLTQMQMAELFQTTKQNISLHTNNVFKEKELDPNSVVKESLTTAADGKRYKTKYYNLDVIISVGYRVKSIRGTQSGVAVAIYDGMISKQLRLDVEKHNAQYPEVKLHPYKKLRCAELQPSATMKEPSLNHLYLSILNDNCLYQEPSLSGASPDV